MYFVESCSYFIPDVSHSVQTQRNPPVLLMITTCFSFVLSVTITPRKESESEEVIWQTWVNIMWIKFSKDCLIYEHLWLSYINNAGYFTMKRTAPMIKRQNWCTVPLKAAGWCLLAPHKLQFAFWLWRRSTTPSEQSLINVFSGQQWRSEERRD